VPAAVNHPAHPFHVKPCRSHETNLLIEAAADADGRRPEEISRDMMHRDAFRRLDEVM
jgi:hypothetical protein